jgi:hypothetical protein
LTGALYELAPPPMQLALPITARLKVIASLNIAEQQIPQDGPDKNHYWWPPGRPARVHAPDPVLAVVVGTIVIALFLPIVRLIQQLS